MASLIFLNSTHRSLISIFSRISDFNDVLFIPLTIFSAWYIAVALPHLTLQHVMLYLSCWQTDY